MNEDSISFVHKSPRKEPVKPSWSQLKGSIAQKRHFLSTLARKAPHSFAFRTLKNGNVRLYFLHNGLGSRTSLAYCDVGTGDEIDPSHRIPVHSLFEPAGLTLASAAISREEAAILERKRMNMTGISSFHLDSRSGRIAFAKGSSLFSVLDPGTTSPPPGQSNSTTVSCELIPMEIPTDPPCHAVINTSISPKCSSLCAFIKNGDIWVADLDVGTLAQLTVTEHPCSAGVPSFVIQEEFDRYEGAWWEPRPQGFEESPSGTIHRILYEEVDDSCVDAYQFGCAMNADEVLEEYRFPRAGSPNSKSTLKILQFRHYPSRPSPESTGTEDAFTSPVAVKSRRTELSSTARCACVSVDDITVLEMNPPLATLFPSAEYLVRAGWCPDGKMIWCKLLNRPQQDLKIVLIPVSCFKPVQSEVHDSSMDEGDAVMDGSLDRHPHNHQTGGPIEVVTIDSDPWVNVDDVMHFLKSDHPSVIDFIYASDSTGWRHLFRATVDTSKVPCSVKRTQLTSGEWDVIGKPIWVNQTEGVVFFTGLRDSPLEKHLYVVSLKEPQNVRRLTDPGSYHSVHCDENASLLVCRSSSLRSLPVVRVFRVRVKDPFNQLPSAPSAPVPAPYANGLIPNGEKPNTPPFPLDISLPSLGYLVPPEVLPSGYQAPELFSFTSAAGDVLHGFLFRPPGAINSPGTRYPTVLSVYGGPGVQLITTAFQGAKQARNHLLSMMGFCVVVLDNRGSSNRGKKFESAVRGNLGSVELEDQVGALRWLAETTGCIDLSRVAVHGWSYGGYLSLMAIAKYPDHFKVAIAGAPVISWFLYDTGYTERYLGYPTVDKASYDLASVLNWTNRLPDEENRILLFHGLMDDNVQFSHTTRLIDALIRAGKPYQLQIFPGERHSLRRHEAWEHYELSFISFLKQHL